MSEVLKKILVIDDYEDFRETLCEQLEGESLKILQAKNGKEAQGIISIEKPKLIISDLRMPEVHGLELLHWLKRNHPTSKIILMTGHPDMLERAEAIELGALGLLFKPFQYEELKSLIQKHFSLAREKSKTSERKEDDEKDFLQVTLKEFITGSNSKYPLYLKISNTRFVKIINKDEKVEVEEIDRLIKKGVKCLYIKRDDYNKYIALILKVNEVIKSKSSIDDEKKKKFLFHTNEVIMEKLYHSDFNRDDLVQAHSVVKSSLQVVSNNSTLSSLLKTLKDYGEHAYAHNLAVSLYSVMLSKQMGWHASKTLSFLSIGGLFHDIGIKKINSEITGKDYQIMTSEEKSAYEAHPVYGVEILTNIGDIPKEVLQIVMQHHERLNSTGYPFGLSHTSIYPLAQLVGLVDRFVELVLNHTPALSITPKAAVKKLIDENEGEFNKEMLKNLSSLFSVP
ncbi:MAG: response regulator [Halobacteriovoraceae bacterium]|jgi:putative nucleotidyltransferase with HDIG domain|nr:response regulator [Halobacteriovoraceae bacterium]